YVLGCSLFFVENPPGRGTGPTYPPGRALRACMPQAAVKRPGSPRECRDGRSLLNACRRAAAAARRRACSGASAPPRRACFSQEVSAGGRDGRGNVRGQERAALRSRRCDFFGRQAFHRPVPGAWSLRGRFVFQPRASVLA
ncbi:unnamed protein product, partial [Prorocentrum cordatum]